MARGFLGKNLTFWGMVGVVMTALKLKDRWDDYQQVPTEDGLGHGPVALHSPVDEEAGRNLPDNLSIDTTIPMATRPKRKRHADCCVCCGLKCGIFWKAFGIVFLVFVLWQSVKLVFWLMTPSPTGLEGMPAYSTSLGCEKAQFLYNPDQTIYSIPVGASKADHSITIRGQAVGTILLAEGASDAEDIEFEMNLRTDDQTLLNKVKFSYSSTEDPESFVNLNTPTTWDKCMRFDVVLRVPPSLKDLTIKSSSVTQVKFAEDAQISLDNLHVSLQSIKENSDVTMILPHAKVLAKKLLLQVYRGWIVGEASIVDETSLDTHLGNGVLNVHVIPTPHTDADSTPAKATLNTLTGDGRADIFYEGDHSTPHRQISSTHRVSNSREGDLYLTYKKAGFNGHVDVKAKSYTATGVMGMFNRTSDALPWVGDENGSDMLTAESPTGWVGLYF